MEAPEDEDPRSGESGQIWLMSFRLRNFALR